MCCSACATCASSRSATSCGKPARASLAYQALGAVLQCMPHLRVFCLAASCNKPARTGAGRARGFGGRDCACMLCSGASICQCPSCTTGEGLPALVASGPQRPTCSSRLAGTGNPSTFGFSGTCMSLLPHRGFRVRVIPNPVAAAQGPDARRARAVPRAGDAGAARLRPVHVCLAGHQRGAGMPAQA